MRNILEILQEVGAVLTDDHFVYTSGKHGRVYVNKDALYPHTRQSSEVGELFADKYKHEDVDIVVAPALGGIVLSQWTAYHLSRINCKDILGMYTEKGPDKKQILSRSYNELISGKNVLVVEDITTTGGSVKETMEVIRVSSGIVVAVCAMINRNPDELNSEVIGAPFSSLGFLKAEVFAAAECPLCQDRVPINVSVGHGREFLANRSSMRA